MNFSIAACRKDECRSLFKKCFKNPIFSLVPFEIWRDLIVLSADAKTISSLSQTCWGFKEIVEEFGSKYLNLALSFRKEGKIAIARRYLFKCVKNGNTLAMFHLAYSYSFCGWGLSEDRNCSAAWFEKGAKSGNAYAIVYHAKKIAEYGFDESHILLRQHAFEKALSSDDSFPVGYCYFNGLDVNVDFEKAFSFFEKSAELGNEFAQHELACCYYNGKGVKQNFEKAFFWFMKAAVQGLCNSQYFCGTMCLYGFGCEKDERKGVYWLEKSQRQGHTQGSRELIRARLFLELFEKQNRKK